MPIPFAVPPPPAAVLAEILVDAELHGTNRVLARAERRGARRASPERDLAWAWAMTLHHAGPGGWCDRARDLLLPLDDPTWLPWVQLVDARRLRVCRGNAWPEVDVARERLARGAWNEALAEIESVTATAPNTGPALHSELLETRASHYFGAGEHERAVADLRTAIEVDTRPELRIRLGMSLMALGEEKEARAQLAVGLLTGTDHTQLAERARIALDVLGVDEGPMPVSPFEPGEVFPDLAIEWLHGPGALSDLDGPLVVDLWASWCAPCIAAMPHLASAAPRWAAQGVSVVGLSVDEHAIAWKRVVLDRDPGYPTGWSGPEAMASLRLTALPAAFVLDSERRVVGFVPGWTGPGDRRLDDLVEQANGSQQ